MAVDGLHTVHIMDPSHGGESLVPFPAILETRAFDNLGFGSENEHVR